MSKIALKHKFSQLLLSNSEMDSKTSKTQTYINSLEIIHEMLFIQEKKLKLNAQSDSIKTKSFRVFKQMQQDFHKHC